MQFGLLVPLRRRLRSPQARHPHGVENGKTRNSGIPRGDPSGLPERTRNRREPGRLQLDRKRPLRPRRSLAHHLDGQGRQTRAGDVRGQVSSTEAYSSLTLPWRGRVARTRRCEASLGAGGVGWRSISGVGVSLVRLWLPANHGPPHKSVRAQPPNRR